MSVNKDELIEKWKRIQKEIASKAIVLNDEIIDHDEERESSIFYHSPTLIKKSTEEDNEQGSYKIFRNTAIDKIMQKEELLIGGVDISFPPAKAANNSASKNQAIAVYVILKLKKKKTDSHPNGSFQVETELVYMDHEIFELTVPYISSFLAFREIEPILRLIEKGKKKNEGSLSKIKPDLIMVDGNGIFHERCAGLATFVGVRTNIRTIGVSKSLYCFDGLTVDLVDVGISDRLATFLHDTSSLPDEINNNCNTVIDCENVSLILDGNNIQGGSENQTTASPEKISLMKKNMKSMIVELAKYTSHGLALKLVGESKTTWATALVGHGGGGGMKQKRKKKKITGGTKKPIFISVGHKFSLEEATFITALCCESSRIPEPIRIADLKGREWMRKRYDGV